jgi:hypothetical protein
MSRLVRAALLLALTSAPAAAQETCPFPGQRPMLVVQLFFGQTVHGKGLVSARSWQRFLAETVTPSLPDGFTVYDAYGQWRDPRTRGIGREGTKVVEAASVDTPEFRARVANLADAYRTRFDQRSVGILAQPGCGAF